MSTHDIAFRGHDPDELGDELSPEWYGIAATVLRVGNPDAVVLFNSNDLYPNEWYRERQERFNAAVVDLTGIPVLTGMMDGHRYDRVHYDEPSAGVVAGRFRDLADDLEDLRVALARG